MLKTKLLLSLTIFILSAGIFAQSNITVDSYLKRASWTEQDGGWMDPETGIIWGPEIEPVSWGEAKAFCANLKRGGKTDWRLPSIDELQYSICKVAGYPTRTACPKPRDHQRDLWLLNKDMKKGITYWASNVIPGDPYNSYYFVFDKEGQHVLTSKGDKSMARCVRQGVLPVATSASAALAAKNAEQAEQPKKEKAKHSFYIAPMIGFGGFFTNETLLENTPFMTGELRLGFNVVDKMMVTFFVDTGLDIRNFSYPVMTTVTIGPEYFITDSFSVFGAVGLGVLTGDTMIFPGSTNTETNVGFAWKLGVTWQMIKWGDEDQYALPISLIYDGAKVRYVASTHTVVGAIGFMYFN